VDRCALGCHIGRLHIPSREEFAPCIARTGGDCGYAAGGHCRPLFACRPERLQAPKRTGDALEARLALIERAQRTLDLQYFIWNADSTGRTMLAAVRDAALRGVRVRLLLDDLYTSETEALLQGLSGFDGVEVRLFNPFPSGRGSLFGRIAGSLGEFTRIRHRMHNKLLVADNVVAITGGRNIGDPYLTTGNGSFFDADILAMGPVVRELSGSFDHYWNSEHAYAGELFWPDAGKADQRAQFDSAIAPRPRHAKPASRSAAASDPAGQIAAGSVSLQNCTARVFFDTTDKVIGANLVDATGTVHERVVDVFVMAQRDLYVASPYFVRGRVGLERIRSLRDRGVRLRLLTNSASSTDEPLAHAVYLRYRQSLLEAGLDLREFAGPPPTENDSSSVSASALHAKLAVIDARYVYVGSLNFTGRSERINTELGLILDCPALASQVAALMEAAPAYHVRMKSDGPGLQWVDQRESPPRVSDVEPGTSLWQRIKSSLLGRLVPEGEI
jgi:putative cardiolipin synthase